MNKISVIIPVYKVEKYLDRCVESVVNQTYKNLEIILVDDGSPDNCPKICDEWAKKDKRIKVIHKENGGVSSARNIGLEKATGDYIAFVDADDFIDTTMYEKLMNSVVDNGSDISMCRYKEFYEETGKERIVYENNLSKITTEKIFPYLMGMGGSINEKGTSVIMGSVWRGIYFKNILQDVKFYNLKMCEDLIFIVDLFKKNPKVSIVDEYLYIYVQRSSSVTKEDSIRKNKNVMDAYWILYPKLENEIEKDKLASHKFHFYGGMVSDYLKLGRKRELKELMKLDFMKELGCLENYKYAMKSNKSMGYKIVYWLTYHKLFWLETIILKLFRR